MTQAGLPGVRGAGRIIGNLAVAAFFFLLLLSLFRLVHVPWTVATGFVAFAALSAIRPSLALLAVAASVPVAGYVGARAAYAVAWPEVVVVAFAAGWWLRSAFRAGDPPPLAPALRIFCLLFSALIVTSAIVDLSALRLTLDVSEIAPLLWTHAWTRYFIASHEFPALQAGALLIEGLVVFAAAARLVAADPPFLGRLVRALVTGAALAAVVSILELAGSAARSAEFWPTFARYFTSERFSVLYADVNAAGSHYAMMMIVAAALAWSQPRRWWLWAPVAFLIAATFWLSGSRTALLACPLALAAMLPLRLPLPTRTGKGLLWAAGGALVLIVLAVMLILPARTGHVASSLATQVRIELSQTALRMTRERPIFGVGLGQFQQRSGEFSSPELLRIFPPASHENAHNNFLQILAELGVLGFAAFMGVIVLAFAAACSRGSAASRDMLAWGCGAGALVFLLTCLGGHPLLIRQPAYSFWMILGAMAGAGAGLADGKRSHAWGPRRRIAVGLALLVIAASVPVRARVHMRSANLEHVGVGVSLWETAPDGVRYREAVNTGSVFVPTVAGFRLLVQPIAVNPVRLELRLDGRLANVVVLEPGRWNTIVMPLPSNTVRRFARLDFTVLESTSDVPLWITKVEPIGQ